MVNITYGLFAAAACVNILMLLVLYFARRKAGRNPESSVFPPFSIVIAARNEAENLERFLPSFLGQDYPLFEVVVVLDRCTDNSIEVVKRFQQEFSYLKMLVVDEIPDGWSPKKYVLTQGIGLAQYEHLALTDADCEAGTLWLRKISGGFLEGKEIVLGISPYFRENTLLNSLIQYETYYSALQYTGFAVLGMPYMGVGRNIAYKKSFFQKVNGFEAFKERLSGDDDLFVNAYGNAQNVGVVVSPDSFIFSVPKMTWKEWIRQKLRHVSAGNRYSLKTKLSLTAFGFSFIGFYFWGGVCLLTGISIWKILIPFSFRMIIGFVIFFKTERHIYFKKMLYLYPILDFILVIYSAVIIPSGMLIRPKWK